MKKILILIIVCITYSYGLNAQEFYGKEADKTFQGSKMIRMSKLTGNPDYILFREDAMPEYSVLHNWLQKAFQTSPEMGIQLVNSIEDKLGFIHYRYRQTCNNIPVNEAMFIVHVKNNLIQAVNGNIFSNVPVVNQFSISAEVALQSAMQHVGAEVYKWQLPDEEKFIKDLTANENATFFPLATPEIIFDKESGAYLYVYKFDIYAHKPMSRNYIYVDASSAKVVRERSRIHTTDVPGTAVTKYSGTQNITTDSTAPGSYRLREEGRGNGIRTFNMLQGTNYSNAVDFTDADNHWNNVNAQIDEAAADAHWGTEMTYDYYFLEHGRNSIDGNGFALTSFLHYDQNYANAFWNGQYMTYGDGNNGKPYCALDVTAHEITHGLDSYTADLDYADEPGALNEGFSDIFGTAVEFYAKPSLANWTCGENLGFVIRNLANPNATQNPDTYLGTYWDPGQEVHQNSTVFSHWFYRVSQGGSGTNDIGNAFSVTGIGIEDAGDIAYRMLAVYLINTSDFADARFYAIVSATDLFGGCSPEVETVTNAMYAVGIGPQYVDSVQVDFSAFSTTFCTAPATVQFQNSSTNATTYLWDFGDGSNSALASPSHTYTTTGNFNVKLVGQSTGCGSDSLIQTAFVSINTSNSNISAIPSTGSGQSLSCCSGTLYDSGENGNYQNNTNGRVTIAPTGASKVILTFSSFNFEPGYDYLYIYDGPSTASPLIGQFDGVGLPNGGVIQSTGGSITLRQTSDGGLTESGFELTWQCSMPDQPPVSNFYASVTETCTGVVTFQDMSLNGPQTWYWDFGDGSFSTVQNPVHAYQTDGLYTVKLRTENTFGDDTLTISDYILVDMPAIPATIPAAGCDSNSVVLSASGSGQMSWYDLPVGGTLLYSGTSFTTPVLYVTDTFYVEDRIIPSVLYGGKPTNSGSGGYFGSTSNIHYQIFNCYTPLTLRSVKVYAQGSGSRTILLRDSSMNVLQSVTVNVPDGESRVTLNFPLPVASKLQLVGDGSPDFYRNNNGAATYPYTLPGKLSVTESSASLPPYNVTGNYYYFYDWEVQEPECASPRVPVIASIYECNGVRDIDFLSKIKIYPNPANDELFVEFPEGRDAEYVLNLCDMPGKVVLSKSVILSTTTDKTIRVDISSVSAGMYFINIISNSSSLSRKIMVK